MVKIIEVKLIQGLESSIELIGKMTWLAKDAILGTKTKILSGKN